MQDVLPDLISSQQTAYMAKRCIGEGTTRNSNLFEIKN